MASEFDHHDSGDQIDEAQVTSTARITLYEAFLIYALGAVAMIPWAYLNARDDGLSDSLTRISAYATVGSIVPALLCIGLAAWRRSFTLGAAVVVFVALMAWRGH